MRPRAEGLRSRVATIALSVIVVTVACGHRAGGDGSGGRGGTTASSDGGRDSNGGAGAGAGSSAASGAASGVAGAGDATGAPRGGAGVRGSAGAGDAAVAGGGAGIGGAAASAGTSGASDGDDASAPSGGAGGGAAASVPAELLDLGNWKLTLPVAGASATTPREVPQPELQSFALEPYFCLAPALDGVQFRAHAGGVTTKNSGYPRSELREMRDGGASEASWSTSSGTHAMTIAQAITHLPVAKPQVVAGQIHDASNDVVMIRLEDKRLFVEGGGNDLGLLDANYTLGTPFTLKLLAESGQIHVFYNDLATPKVTVTRAATGCYFKAGVYTQSNVSHGDAPDAYGEVVITSLAVDHR